MRELEEKESWAVKNWCFWTVVLEKTLECPLDCKEIQQVHPKGNQSWVFIGRTNAEAETSIYWPPDAKNWLIGKYLDAGKDWRQEEKGMTEDEMVAWYHWFNWYEFVQTSAVGDREASSAVVHGVAELDMTERPNWTDCIVLFLSVFNWSLVNQFCVAVPWYIFLSYDIIYFKSAFMLHFQAHQSSFVFLELHRKDTCALSLFHDACKHHKGRQIVF